jgi:MFS family permease
MSIATYRSILSRPGVFRLLGFAVLARVPHAASGVVITMFVVLGMGKGYAAAGLVAAFSTVGTAIGAPWRGRAVDRYGLRKALLPSVVVEAVTWAAVPFVGYHALLLIAFVGGLMAVPIFTVVRQSLSVLVPEPQQRAAFALEAIATEVTFMAGPAIGVVLATQWSTTGTVLLCGAAFVLAGLGLMIFDPPTRSGSAEPPAAEILDDVVVVAGAAPTTRALLLNPAMLAVLAATAGSLAVLSGTDVSIVANVRASGQLGLSWIVFVVWSFASMLGGILFGAIRRPVPVYQLLLGLGLLTVPIGLAGNVWWLIVAVIPAGFLTAPTLSATAAALSRLVPEARRGEAMGWYGSAATLGITVGTPAAGWAIDLFAPWAGFALLGTLGSGVALIGLLLIGWRTDRPGPEGKPDEPGAPSGVSPTRRQPVSTSST